MATFVGAAPWAIELPSRRGASFHAVLRGTCWLITDGAAPQLLSPGDVVLLPAGSRHQLASETGLSPRRLDEDLKAALITPEGELVLEGTGTRTRILCAGYTYDTDVAHPLLSLLPPVLHVPTADSEQLPALRGLLDLLAHETGSRAETGSDPAVSRLLDLLLIHVLRIWLRAAPAPSWLGAMRDPITATALGLLHAQPAAPWTLDRLAAAANVSRSTLARRFTRHVGEPPLAYLARWRMDLAARLLRQTDQPAVMIARAVGYTSEYAFNRAFTRHRGSPPGRYRTSTTF